MDPIADMLVRIRNAMTSRHKEVKIPYSKIKFEIARILLEEGYINNFRTEGGRRGPGIEQERQMPNVPIPDTRPPTADARKPKTEPKRILIQLKYLDGGKSVIYGMKRLSKSSRRIYVGSDEIPRVLGGLGISILSTSRGIMTDREARKEGAGGELLASIW